MGDYLYTLPNATGGLDAIVIQTLTVYPLLASIMLFFVWVVVFLGGISRQKLRTGTADYPAWAVAASVATLLPALLFSVTAGFISLDWLVIVVSMNIASAFWFFMDRRVSEI